jgi:hypothetical protein
MTKGRVALPGRAVAGQRAFFIILGGHRPMTPPVWMAKGRAALPSELDDAG